MRWLSVNVNLLVLQRSANALKTASGVQHAVTVAWDVATEVLIK